MKEKTAEKIFSGVGQAALAIEVTSHCNSVCLHCFARSDISRHASLPVDLVKEIILEGYAAGYRHLHITGGEPLLWEGFFEALDYGFGVGYETIFVNTNGTLITDKVSKRLAEYRNFSISVSLDGPEHLHDRIRGKGAHRRTLRGLARALDDGNHCTIFTTVTKTLLPELPYFTNDLYKAFPTIDCLILIQLIQMTPGDFALSKELLEPEDFISLVRMAALLNIGGFRTIVKKNPVANVVSELLEMPWVPRVPPLYREGSMIVLANGDISVVHSSRKSFGSYKTGMLQSVLASDGYRRTVARDQDTCPACRYTQLCEENGMIRPSQGYGDLYQDTPFCRCVLETLEMTPGVLNVTPEQHEASRY